MEKYFIQGKIRREVKVEQVTYKDGRPYFVNIIIDGISRPITIISCEDGYVDIMMVTPSGIDVLNLDHCNEELPADERKIAEMRLQDSGRLS